MNIRPARPEDAGGMSRVLDEIFQAGLREAPGDPTLVLEQYIEHPNRIQCLIAMDHDCRILGFQSLKRAWNGNPYGLPEGWGIIGTHISPGAARRGIGTALFQASLQAAKASSLEAIDATIRQTNEPALAYYEALGFRIHRTTEGRIGKALHFRSVP